MLPFRRRAETPRACSIILLLLVVMLSSMQPVWADKTKNKSKPSKKKKARAEASAAASGSPGEQNLTNIPLPIGHEAKGLVLPDFDLEGHLRGKFVAASARRLDQEQVKFEDLKITTFTPENQTDLQIDLHSSIFNLKTKVLSSQERSMVKRADFNIIGDTISFDVDARTGKMVGNVKMVITSQSNLVEHAGQ